MHPLVLVMLIASGALAHYRSYDTRNLLEREEPEADDEGVTVECPVCDNSNSFVVNTEVCPIKIGGKSYKKCKYGTYNNPKCGNRLDCLRGPGDRCSEKAAYDYYGERCAPGYYCNPTVGECTGLEHDLPSNLKWFISHNMRYPNVPDRLPLKPGYTDRSSFNPNYPIRAK